jgi:tetratricopeptide (TPR) repeat protein
MKKWITVSLVLLAFGALAVAASPLLLPLLGLAGAGNEKIKPLREFLPWIVWILLGAIALLLVNLNWDRFRRHKPRRLVDEAEQWSNDFQIGADLTVNPPTVPAEPIAEERATEPVEVSAEAADSLSPTSQSPGASITEPVSAIGAPPSQPDVVTVTPTAAHEQSLVEADVPDVIAELKPLPKRRDRVTVAFADEPKTEVVELPVTDEETAPSPSGPEDEAKLTPADIAKAAALAQAENFPASRHQLPPLPEAFAGRAFELEELIAALANPENKLLGIQGLGGTGKTALALTLAHRLAPRYPDAQFYLDLRGASTRPLSTAEAQAHILRVYHPGAKLPENEADLNQAYQTALTGRRALLLLDNAASAQQVRPLLPPAGNLLIVTSRQHFTLPGLFLRLLGALTESEAEELLLRLVPRIGEHAQQIARQCGYLPMALRIAASALAQRPELTASSYSWKLAQISQRSNADVPPKPVETALTLSYELLSPGLQKLWRTLAVFPDSFDVIGAAAIWSLHPGRAQKALRRLMDFELIEGNLATGRYRLHDLKHNFADALLRDPERSVCQQRHAEYYQSVLHEADALYEQGGEALKSGLSLVDREWHNIEAGHTWATAHAEHDRAARELCSSYPDAGRYVLDLRQHPRERIRWCETALAAAARLDRRKAESRHLLAMGKAYLHLSELHHALDCYEQALGITREYGDQGGEARALNGLGAVHYADNAMDEARSHYERALEVARASGDQRSEAQALGGLGQVHSALGELEQALELLEHQLALARQVGDRHGEANALGGLGLAHYSLGRPNRAVELLEQQLAITREIGDRRGEANALNHLGHAYAELKQHDAALIFHEQALFITREISDRRGEAAALGGIGIAWYLKGDTARSIEFLEQQLRLARDTGDQRGEVLALGNLGEAYLAQRDVGRAVETLQRAFEMCAKIGDTAGQGHALFQLALAHNQRGERPQAIAQAEAALELLQAANSSLAEEVRKQLAEWDVAEAAGNG